MKIAVAGKGGVGKTTVSGTIARALARSGHTVLALDADLNPMLGVSLGVGGEQTELIVAARQAIAEGEAEHAPTIEEIVDRFGADAPDGVRMVIASRVEYMDRVAAAREGAGDRARHRCLAHSALTGHRDLHAGQPTPDPL